MYLKTLHLRHFRNYADRAIAFRAPKTIVVGENAQGKTNLLEAVELAATLRSRRVSRDADLIQTGQTRGQIQVELLREAGPADASLTLHQRGRRVVRVNGETLRRQMDLLGLLNAVPFSSLDLDLVRGGPQQRRSWLDGLLVQLEPIYAHLWQQYDRVLKQRNALLRQRAKALRDVALGGRETPAVPRGEEPGGAASGDPDRQPAGALPDLALWDAQLAAAGARVVRRRARAIARLAPLARAWQARIAGDGGDGDREVLSVDYAPSLAIAPEVGPDLRQGDGPEATAAVQAAFLDQLQAKAAAERYQGTTLVGPHRDDVAFSIDGAPARQYGSQGQQRTLVLALKLAELELIETVVGEPPLLLLDDVLAELDLNRQNQLLDAIESRFQTLLTTTHLGAFDAQWLREAQILTVKAGEIFETDRP